MARAPAHITRRSGVYIYRRRVPDDVRESGFFGGKSHYQVSLRTGDLNEAKARALPLGIRFEAEVANLRSGSVKAPVLKQGKQRVLTDEALESIQAKWFSDTIRRDRENREMADADPGGDWSERMASDDDRLHFDVAQLMDPTKGREALHLMKERLKVEWADFVAMDARRWGVNTGSRDYKRIEDAIIESQIDALKATHLAWLGQEPEPTSRKVQRGLTRNLKPQSSWTLTQLALHVLEVQPKGDSWRHKVLEQVVPLFVSHLGQPQPISNITSSDIRSFLEAMSQCPTNAAQRFRDRSLAEAIQLNRARPKPFPTVSANTIRDTHFAVLRALFGYAVSQEWLVASPAERVKVAGATKKGGSRPSFKMEELQALLSMPVFTGCKSQSQFGTPGEVQIDDHRYWTPLLAVREKISASIRKRIIAGPKKGERRAANKEAEALERASRTANPGQRRKAQDDRRYLDIVGSAEKDGSLASPGLVASKIKKQIGSYRLPHWEKTTLALKVMALSCETAKRGGMAINLRISDALSEKALASSRGPVSFVQNQVRETLKRRFAADAPEFWFVMERDNDRRFHLHGAYETAAHIDHRLVDAALRDAGVWSADAGKGMAQLSKPLTEPLFWASYVVKTINVTAAMTNRKLLGSSAEIKSAARGGWDALRRSLPSSQ